MTKQEQIKEITQIICRRSKDNICLIDKYPCDCNCGWARYAEVIYNEWCRKADEIRKETAKEILNAVDNESNGQTISVTNYLRKKYGVEAEE